MRTNCVICHEEHTSEHVYQDKPICAACYERVQAYADRLSARVERLRAYAEKVKTDGQADYQRAHEMADVIPFGQPILVGHYSEKSDRNYRERIHNTFGRAFAKMERAAELEHKASAAETSRAISSDDPAAILKLQVKLDAAIIDQKHMVETNKHVRAVLLLPEDQRMLELMKRSNVGIKLAAALLKPDFMGRVGYAGYETSNNAANIRRMQTRIDELKAQAARAASEPEPVVVESPDLGVTLERDAEANRVRLRFPGKPAADVIKLLKSRGFHWSPSEMAWQRQLNNGAEYAAQYVIDYLKQNASK